MKQIRFILVTLAAIISLTATAQEENKQEQANQSLSVELLGAHNVIGVNYDKRLKSANGLGYRIGLGYCYSESYSLLHDNSELHGIAVPLELNYLVGKKRSKLELGFGASLGCYFEKYEKSYCNFNKEHSIAEMWTEPKHDCAFGYFFFGDIGYRYQKPKGFIFRVGITPSFTLGDRHGIYRIFFAPHLSFGKSF
jgi:hypothetical protein